jgi:ABC-2 type transport system ATP-binding protein
MVVSAAPPPTVAYTTTSGTLVVTGLPPIAPSTAPTTCSVVYDIYVPADASAAHKVPLILSTNGFGGSKNDQAGVSKLFASRDYEAISYSGLGFGGSTCSIELDSPEWDGQVASRFIDLFAARPEALTDAGGAVVGTWGGSYGGGFQFAAASVDPRVHAMIPAITWNDLSYSLAPNNDAVNRIYSSSPPGVFKFEWTDLFFGLGAAQVAMHPSTSGMPPTGCPGFDMMACTTNAEVHGAGYPSAAAVAWLRHASAQYELFQNLTTHVPPTMLIQGENDTLFNFNDAVANYNGLKARGADVKLVFKAGGHSGSDAAGEVNDIDPSKGYHDQLFLNWYDHYLKGLPVDTGPGLEYFQDWVTYDHSGSAQPAYGSSPSYPVPDQQLLYLSGGGLNTGGDLFGSPAQIVAGAQTFVNPLNGTPASYSETSAVGQAQAPSDPTGEFASFTTPPLSQDTYVAGIPEATFHVSATTASSVDPASELVLFGKLYDVDAAGAITLVHGIVSPIRVADLSKPVHINLPGQVHRYAAGHRIRLVFASTDQAYIGSRVADSITITADPASPSILTLPVVPFQAAIVPESPLAVGLPLAGGLILVLALLLRRRRPAGA